MEQPLVSVPVITYNSSKTVLETLDSIKAQTYQNLELIVSDDCSTDNTVEICRNWIEQNKSRFVRTELLTVEKNTGISANFNRAETACKGEWVKPIAGDDLLMPNCIQDFIKYACRNNGAIYLFSRLIPFSEKQGNRHLMNNIINYNFFSMPEEQQYRYLIFGRNEIPAPTAFYNKTAVELLGVKSDERIPMIDDWPRWINLLKRGVHFHFVDKELVMYRVSEHSISNSNKLSKAYIQSLALFYLYYQHMEYKRKDKLLATKKYINAKKQLNNNMFWKITNRCFIIIYKMVRHE